MTAADPALLRVFISSPGDVAIERDIAEHLVAAVPTAFLSQDRKLVLTASADSSDRLWNVVLDAATRQYFGMHVLSHAGPVNSARWSPDERLISTASDDATARLCSVPRVTSEADAALAADLSESVGRFTVGPLDDLLPTADAAALVQKLQARSTARGASEFDAVLGELSATPP
jgi:hypothetical protein